MGIDGVVVEAKNEGINVGETEGMFVGIKVEGDVVKVAVGTTVGIDVGM